MPNPSGTNQYTRAAGGRKKGRGAKAALSKVTRKSIRFDGSGNAKGKTVGRAGTAAQRRSLASTKVARRYTDKVFAPGKGGNQMIASSNRNKARVRENETARKLIGRS